MEGTFGSRAEHVVKGEPSGQKIARNHDDEEGNG